MSIERLDLDEGRYASAIMLFDKMDNLHRVWNTMRPTHPLRRSEMLLLGSIARFSKRGCKPVTMSYLAKHMRQSAPAISQKVSGMEQAGYLKRTVGKEDRRMAYVELTPKGKKVTENALEEFLGNMQRALDMLGPHRTEELFGALQDLTNAIEKVQQHIPEGEDAE